MPPSAANPRDLRDYGALVRRRWGAVLTSLVLGLAGAFVYLQVAPQTFEATAKVRVIATDSDSAALADRTNDDINLDTEAQLVRSEQVAAEAAADLGSTLTPVELARQVSVTVPPNTTILDITFRAESAAGAQEGAQAFALAYLDARAAAADRAVAREASRIESQIGLTAEQLQDISVQLSDEDDPPSATERVLLVARRLTLQTQLASLSSQLAPVLGIEAEPGEVINDAQLPSRPAEPNLLLVLASGLAAGLLLGMGLAALRERRDRRVHDSADLDRLFDIPVLATFPPSRVAASVPHRSTAGLYHSLRALDTTDKAQSVLVLGLDDLGQTNVIADALAATSARFDPPASQLISGRAKREDERGDDRRERLLDARALNELPYPIVDGDLLEGAFREHMRRLREQVNFIVLGPIDEDPLIDLPVLARHADAVVVLVRYKRVTRDQLAEVLAHLERAQVNEVFAVAIDSSRRARRQSRRQTTATPRAADHHESGSGGSTHPHASARRAVDVAGAGELTPVAAQRDPR